MTQLAIDYGPSDRARVAWRQMLDLVRAIVARVGPKEAAYALDASPSHLSDALAERDRRGVRAEWIPTLLLLADEGEAETLLALLFGLRGFGLARSVRGYEARPVDVGGDSDVLRRLVELLDDELSPKRKSELLRKARGR